VKRHAEFPMTLYTRNAIIDSQHKELIECINRLYDAIDEGKGKEEAIKALQFLSQYTIFHFGGEENLWKKNSYPEYEEHKAAHEKFVEVIRGLHEDLLKNGPNDEFADKVEKEITAWLVNHIMGMDMKGTEWLNTRSGWQMDNLM